MTNEINAHSLSSYSVEERAFHRAFPDLPESEKLIQSCSCCISRRQLIRLGKLYITSLRFCFTSSFLQKPLIIPWEFVVGINTKQNFVMDTITVVDKEEQAHVFSAFFGGRTSQIYSLMHTLWSVRQRLTANIVKNNYDTSNRGGDKKSEDVCLSVKSCPKSSLEVHEERRYDAVETTSSNSSALSTSLGSSISTSFDAAIPRPASRQGEIVSNAALEIKANMCQKRRRHRHVVANELVLTETNKTNSDEKLSNNLLTGKKQTETKTELVAFVGKEHERSKSGSNGECGWEQRVRLLSPELLSSERHNSEFYNTREQEEEREYEEQKQENFHEENTSKNISDQKLNSKDSYEKHEKIKTLSLSSDNLTLLPKRSKRNTELFTKNHDSEEKKMQSLMKNTEIGNEKDTKSDEQATRSLAKEENEKQTLQEERQELSKLLIKQQKREIVERSSSSVVSFSPHEKQSLERDKSPTPESPLTTIEKNFNNNDNNNNNYNNNNTKKENAQVKTEVICNPDNNKNNTDNNNVNVIGQNVNKSVNNNINVNRNNFTNYHGNSINNNEQSPLKTLPLSRSASNLNAETDKSEEKAELLQLFPFLPQTEILLHTFACSYISGIHRIGKMYITNNYILFNSFMLTEPLQIHFHNVKAVIKLQTMMILDGVSLKLSNDRSITFTNFVSRDTAFNILSSAKISFDEKEQEQTTQLVVDDEKLAINDKERDNNKNNNYSSVNMFKTTTSEPVFSKIPSVSSLDAFESLVTDYGTSFSPISAFTTEILAPVPLPVGKTIFDVFKCCFDDDAPVLPEYNNERNYTDQKYSKWRDTADDGSFCGQRVFDCTSVIRALMNKQCHLTQYEKYAFYKVNDKSMLMIQTSGQISNVMLADAFRVESLITFTQTNSVETDSATVVMMHVRSHTHFFRSVLLKGKIVSNANSELKQGMKKLFNLLFKHLNAMKQLEHARSSEVEEYLPVLENATQEKHITPSVSPVVVHQESVNFESYIHLPMEWNKREWRYFILVVMVIIAFTYVYGLMVNLCNKPLQSLMLNGHYTYTLDNAFFELVAHSSALLHSIGLFVAVQLAFCVLYTHKPL